MNVLLSPETEKLVLDMVASGRYTSASEVVHMALLLLKDHEKSRAERLEEFNCETQARIDALDRGIYVTAEESLLHSRERSAGRRKEIADSRF
jgi:antitoxin ParD1/3/4